MLIFQKFIHSWLCYELVKVLYVFGLQPQIRSDISSWSQKLHAPFDYLNNKQHKHKETALEVLNILFDKTEHNSYFNKIILGSKQKFKNMKNPTLCLVILTWLQQLQQCIFEKSDWDTLRDWYQYGWYHGTSTGFVSGRATSSNINISTVKSETCTPVTDVSYFKPNEAIDKTDKSKRKGVCFGGKVLTDKKSPPLFLGQFLILTHHFFCFCLFFLSVPADLVGK
jgi:hypothetical protein